MRIPDDVLLRNSDLATGNPTEQMAKRRQAQREKIARAIVASKNEIPRSELDFGALGGRVIEHVPTGRFYFRFLGDPGYVRDDVRDYFMDESGNPVMLQAASSPSSRADLEQKRAQREERKAAKEAAAKRRREQRTAGR